MQDQAEQLRQMMRGRGGGNNGAAPVRNRTRIIAVSSGKGGVGKTNISTALAIAYAKIGKRLFYLTLIWGWQMSMWLWGLFRSTISIT